MSEKSLTPIEQKQVQFYNDQLTAIRVDSGNVFIPVRPICELLGIDWNGQRRRINRDAVLKTEMRTVDVTSTEGSRQVTRGVLCLPLDFISGFLFGINAARVRDDLRDRVIRYQRECYKVLAEAFQEGRLTAETTSLDNLLNSDSEAAEAYRMAAAIMKLARHQLMLEATQQQHGSQLADHETRLEELESTIGPGTAVSEDQASQISQAVKTVAIATGKQTKRNEFGAVYGELYRRFGITSYKMLPANRFEEAMAFLTEWHSSLEGNEAF